MQRLKYFDKGLCIKDERSAIAYNVSHVCDAAPSLTEARGRCGGAARCSAAEPEAPRRGADAHTRCYAKFRGVTSYPLYNLNGKTSDISLKWASSVNSTRLF